MKKLKKINLKKEIVSVLDKENMEDVKGGFSAGCSDGCGPFQTFYNCTRANCTADCTYGASRFYC